MRLFLVRHAEAAPGEPDELRPLTDAGRTVARALGERLRTERPEAVLSSPLLRARETAEAIARAAGIAAEADEREAEVQPPLLASRERAHPSVALLVEPDDSEHLDAAAVRAPVALEDLDGGCLARAVRAQ